MAGNLLGLFAAIFLGVAAYFAWLNKTEYETQIGLRQQEERELSQAKDLLAKTIGEREDAEEELAERRAFLAEKEDELESQENVVAGLQSTVDDLKENKDDKAETLAAAREAVDAAGNPETLLADVKRYKQEISDNKVAISNEEANRASNEQTSANLIAHIGSTRDYIGLYSRQESAPGLVTSILNTYGDMGFVTIKGGDQAGIIKGSTLLVKRGNDTIAKLLVTSVEKTTAAANIIPNTLAADTSVYPGDKVVPDEPKN